MVASVLQNNDAVISYVNFFRWTRFPIWPNWSQQSRPDSLFGQIGPNRIPSRPARTQLGAPNPAPAATSHAGRTQFVAMRNLAPWGVRPNAIFRNLTGTGSLPKACPGSPSNARTRRPAAQGMRLHATETTSCDMGGSSSSLVITRCARNQGPPMDCDTYIERPLNRRASCAGTSNAPGASSTVVLVALGID